MTQSSQSSSVNTVTVMTAGTSFARFLGRTSAVNGEALLHAMRIRRLRLQHRSDRDGFVSAAKIDDFEPLCHIRVVRRGPLDQDQIISRNTPRRHPSFRP